MGAASVSCEPPCACEARESLQGHAPASKVSVTVLRAIRVSRPSQPAAGEGDHGACVLKVVATRGVRGGERFQVTAAIMSRSRGLLAEGRADELPPSTLIRMESSLSHVEGDQLDSE